MVRMTGEVRCPGVNKQKITSLACDVREVP